MIKGTKFFALLAGIFLNISNVYPDCVDRCVAEACGNCTVMTARMVHPKVECPRGTILFLPGRSGILGDREPILQALYQRGFDVYTLDWRGQGESSRLLEDSHRVHIENFDHYVDDVCALKMRVRLENAPKPWIIVGHSLGGHIALRILEEAPCDIAGAILVAPMIDAYTGPTPRFIAPSLAKMLVTMGLGEQYSPGHGPYDWLQDPFEGNKSTRDPERFVEMKRYLKEHPEYVTGGVTLAWASAMFDSIGKTNDISNLSKVSVPVLMLNAGSDEIVNAKGAVRVAASLNDCREVTLAGARHALFNEIEETRQEVWQEVDCFLNKLAPALCPLSNRMDLAQ